MRNKKQIVGSKQETKSGCSCRPCLGSAMVVEIPIWIIRSYNFMNLPVQAVQNDLNLLKIFSRITTIIQDRKILTISNDPDFL